MNEAQEKALWDFVRALADWEIADIPTDDPEWGLRANRARKIARKTARALLSVLAKEAPPPLMALDDRTAPAPKQERGVEEFLDRAWGLLEIGEAANLVQAAVNRYRQEKEERREERAESEKDRAAMLSTYGEIQTLGRENDILRESVEKALSILTPHVNSRRPCSCAVCKAVNALEGNSEGTEATK